MALVERERGLRQSYDRIEHASDLIRPIVAAEDVTADKTAARRQIESHISRFGGFASQFAPARCRPAAYETEVASSPEPFAMTPFARGKMTPTTPLRWNCVGCF